MLKLCFTLHGIIYAVLSEQFGRVVGGFFLWGRGGISAVMAFMFFLNQPAKKVSLVLVLGFNRGWKSCFYLEEKKVYLLVLQYEYYAGTDLES